MVVVCGGTNWDGNRFPEHHVAEQLARRCPVLFVDPPLSPVTALQHPELRVSMREHRLRLVSPSLARLTPLAPPGKDRVLVSTLTDLVVRRAIHFATATLGGCVRALITNNPQHALFGASGEATRVYYAADDYTAGADLMGRSVERLRRSEARIAGAADLVVAASVPIAERWECAGRRVLLMPNGCDDRLFAGTDAALLPDDVDLPSPVVGFFGHLSKRIDLEMLAAVAHRGRSLLLVGPRQATFPLALLTGVLDLPNVRWVGAKPFAALPSYLRCVDVGIVPYADTPFNRASFPLKVLEYLAAGRGVVATDLPAVRWLATDLVTIASEPTAFADAVDEALTQGRPPDVVARRRAFAAEHSWSRRVRVLAEALGLGPDPAAGDGGEGR